MKKINLPTDDFSFIKAGDEVEITGILYVGRDQVHKILKEKIERNEELPFTFEGNAIYYMGPSPSPKGRVIGAAGPTTSKRMDPYSPTLIKQGLKIMIGKGERNEETKRAIKTYHGLYLIAYGGCGALYSSKIKKKEVVAYSFLGPEALLKLEVEDFPVFCMIDSDGNEYHA